MFKTDFDFMTKLKIKSSKNKTKILQSLSRLPFKPENHKPDLVQPD